MKKIKKLAIANRGEVAVRIVRAAQEMGMKTVLLHSEVDTQSIAYRLCDEHVCIGPAPSAQSYLDMQRNVDAALSVGAEAIHPGFGFLSENADFSDLCTSSGLIFVGPTGKSIRSLGDKITAKSLAKAAGIETIPGYDGKDQSLETLKKEASRIGYPVIVKSSAGGGGRGLRVVRSEPEFAECVESAKNEAKAGFASNEVFLEKYFENAKHIEFQIFGDQQGRVLHLSERECSVQRRHQKVIEEGPSIALNPKLREEMGGAAKKLAESAQYTGAGTVEFLLSDGKYYFLEMNTRLQVEHTVTEEIMCVDLVKAQLLIAQGEPCPWVQSALVPRGHAIECRIVAEDSYKGGIPSIGLLGPMIWPQGPGRRFEVGFEPGDEVFPYYDSMIAKIIVYDETRPKAIQKMLRTLSETIITGVHTNIPLLKSILQHENFVSGQFTTQFIPRFYPDGLTEPKTQQDREKLETQLRLFAGPQTSQPSTTTENPALSPWAGPWRNS
ncbi:MAG: acetyl/propionyl/methylcrotonyl-CoA carboxylase subunit alpha [Bdellovibrionales bacterium]